MENNMILSKHFLSNLLITCVDIHYIIVDSSINI